MNNWELRFSSEQDAVIRSDGDAVILRAYKENLNIREYVFESHGVYSSDEYLILDYEAFGITRSHELRAAFISGKTEEQGAFSQLVILNDIIVDGHRHRITVRMAEARGYTEIRLAFRVRSTHAWLKIFRLCSCRSEELEKRFSRFRTVEKKEGYRPIDLRNAYNDSMPESAGSIDSGIGMPAADTVLDGIPFCFGTPERNIIQPGAAPAENDEIILNFGIPAKRGKCRPVSRDSKISVEIHDTAKEILFAAVIRGNLYERWGFCAKDPTILGAAIGEVMKPMAVQDVERFMVEILYEDGSRDTAFPYNPELGRHVMTGETGIYAVPALPKRIDRVIFHNRIINTDIAIAALTLNAAAPCVIPKKEHWTADAFRIPEVRNGEAGNDFGQGIARTADTLVLRSGAAKLVLRVQDGIRIESLKNGWVKNSSVTGYLLKLRTPDGKILERIPSEIVYVSERQAWIECGYEELRLKVCLEAREKDVFHMKLAAENTGKSVCSVGILFPVLDDVRFADWQDGWYMFPKYQNACDNGHISVYEESAPSFPMQFLDLFSPSQNGGIGVLTKERRTVVRKYAIEKDDERIQTFVEYPAMYMSLKAGELFEAAETELFVHSGDWHYSFRRYRDWLKTWYVPYKCQNKEWYRSRFWLTAEITDFFESEDFSRLPVWYNPSDGTYNFQKIMDEQKEIYGFYPDILHLWGWCYDTEKKRNQWGHYGKEDYDRLGGLENLRTALNRCAEETGAEISLYLHPTLLTSSYPEAGEYQPELMVRNANGDTIGLEEAYRMCHANEKWRRHSLDTYHRVINETGFNIYYVDEFGLRVENRCYAGNHGHSVPSNLLLTDQEYISRLREETDGNTVLYGEYAAADINACYIDCNISYHILDSIRDMIETSWMEDDGDDTDGKVMTDLYRFAFPKIVQLVLPMAMRNLSWQPLKSTFFNVEAIYDSFWDAEESRGVAFMAKAFSIKKKYADCYISDEPDTMLRSPAEGVYINVFPGKDRTVYNLYNSSCVTRHGVLLILPYSDDLEYFDVWNEEKCVTERKGEQIFVYGSIDAQDVGCIAAEKRKD